MTRDVLVAIERGEPVEIVLGEAPQSKTLALVTCGARYAIAERGSWSAQGRWAWWWKDRIDRGWLASFR